MIEFNQPQGVEVELQPESTPIRRVAVTVQPAPAQPAPAPAQPVAAQPTPAPAPAQPVAAQPSETTKSTYQNRAIGMLMRIADTYREQNNFRQATEMYFDILHKYPDAPEARLAHERLMELAAYYESRGELRQARYICEQLT
jgi:hypothetical protein